MSVEFETISESTIIQNATAQESYMPNLSLTTANLNTVFGHDQPEHCFSTEALLCVRYIAWCML